MCIRILNSAPEQGKITIKTIQLILMSEELGVLPEEHRAFCRLEILHGGMRYIAI
jgi:hypothetical protein